MNLDNKFFIAIFGILLAILLLAPSFLTKNCPLKLANDPTPGRCSLYTDENQDQVCDLSQAILGTGTGATLSKDNITSQIFNFEVISFILLLILVPFLLFWRKFLWLRWLTLVFGFTYLGFLKEKALCPLFTLQNLFLLKTRLVIALTPFLIFLLPILLSLIFGRVFCGWLCPLGAYQEFIFKIREGVRRLFKIKKIEINPLWQRIINYRLHYLNPHTNTPIHWWWGHIKNFGVGVKYIILLIIILAVVVRKRTILCGLDPFGALFGFFQSPVTWVMLAIFTLLSLLVFRPWCKYVCPYGTVLSILAKISLFKIKLNKKQCRECGVCRRVCLSKAIDKNKIDQAECNRCGDCLTKCPSKAINFQQ